MVLCVGTAWNVQFYSITQKQHPPPKKKKKKKRITFSKGIAWGKLFTVPKLFSQHVECFV